MLLIFKNYIYRSRETRVLCYETLIIQISKVQKIEKQLRTHKEKLLYPKSNGK